MLLSSTSWTKVFNFSQFNRGTFFIRSEFFINHYNLKPYSISGKQDIILTAILEFVEICLANNNVPQARRLLSDAETLIQQVSKADKHSNNKIT